MNGSGQLNNYQKNSHPLKFDILASNVVNKFSSNIPVDTFLPFFNHGNRTTSRAEN